MAEYIAKRNVRGVYTHPNADNLAILKVGEFSVVHSLEESETFTRYQTVVHFPTDICIDPQKAIELGVDKYLQKVRYKNEGEKVACRIRAARLRGVPSYGFISLDTSIPDDELDEYYGVWKYEPPEIPPHIGGNKEREEHPQFPKYTKIKRIQLNPTAWTEGLPVRITEKLHGTNVRLGVVQVDGEWRFMVGSHNVILREFNEQTGERNKYWEMLTEPVMELLNFLCDGEKSVVVYGEMFGPGIQDLDYGCKEPSLRVFDIMVDGHYQDWDLVEQYCNITGVQTVPLLAKCPFTWGIPDSFTDGNTTISAPGMIKSNYKGREGVVITPLTETYSDVLGGRLIAKSISADYESRRGGTEYH